MAVSAAVMIRTSMQDLGVLGAGEAADGLALVDGLRRLQLMLSAWSLDPLTVVQTDREVFATVSGKGSYTIGPGMELNTARPVGQQSLVGAGQIQHAGQPNEVEIPASVLTYDAYAALRVKTLTSSMFTSVFYKPGALEPPFPLPPTPYSVDVGQIVLWPVPTGTNPLVLYLQKALPLFENLTTLYPIPDSYQAAVQYNLTVALAPLFQVSPSAEVVRMARLSLASMKRTNYQFTDVAVDPMFTFGGGASYNIETGGTQRHG